jgi:hypothetical protein
MKDTLSREDRRHLRSSLAASLAVVFALPLSTFAWAGVNPPSSEQPAPAAASAPADPGAGGDANEMLGCGCAEGCAG